MKKLLALLAATAALGVAAQPFPMKPDFERGLGVDAATAAKVESIFAKEREQRLALREKTRAELGKVLNADQLAKFDAMGPGRGRGGPGGPGYGPRGGGPGMGMHYGMGGPGMMGMHRGMGPGAYGECPMWDGAKQAPAKPAS